MTISSATFNSLRPGSLVEEKAKNAESAKENLRRNEREFENGRGRDCHTAYSRSSVVCSARFVWDFCDKVRHVVNFLLT